ncbi:UNVERIFIED_CONTAM: hypothetical protein Scaly_1195500 [Sesamum calycinum]|uniref:Uncharacterized protein n=1 Tax=Sesamum calycinum TaxID=2727403 RepID=A0AAW2Q3V3_9LAMI
MKFTDSPVIELSVHDTRLSIQQDNGSMHVGTSVWPCSLVLVKFAERWDPLRCAADNPYADLLNFANKRGSSLCAEDPTRAFASGVCIRGDRCLCFQEKEEGGGAEFVTGLKIVVHDEKHRKGRPSSLCHPEIPNLSETRAKGVYFVILGFDVVILLVLLQDVLFGANTR